MQNLIFSILLTLLSFEAYCRSAYLVSDSSYDEVNAIYRIDADFNTSPLKFMYTGPHLVIRGGPNGNLKIGNVFYQTMGTTFGASNQSLAYFTENLLTRNFEEVKLVGTNDRNCCKRNIRYLKNSHTLVFRSGWNFDYFQLDPITHLPQHQDVKIWGEHKLDKFDALSVNGQDYIVGISSKDMMFKVFHYSDEKFENVFQKKITDGKLKDIIVLGNGNILIQEEWKLTLVQYSPISHKFNTIKTINFSNDYAIKLLPSADKFIAYSEALDARFYLFDDQLNQLSFFQDPEPDVFIRVISFFNNEYFLMPTYHYKSDVYKLHFFKIDQKKNTITRLSSFLQPFYEQSFVDLLEIQNL